MSYTTPPSTPPAPAARPGTVSLATTLLYLLGLLSLVSVALTIYTATLYDAETIERIYRDAGAASDIAKTSAAAATIFTYVFAGIYALIGVVYMVLAMFVGKGKQWARITSWVWAGLFGICCGVFGVISTAGSGAFSGFGGNTGGIDQAKVAEEMAELVPSWMMPVSLVLGIISLLAAIAVVVLLALPPSGPFFRKPEPQWTPPTYPAP